MDLSTIPTFVITAVILGLVFGSLASIAGFAYVCICIWDKLRRRPSIDETLREIVTKPDLHQAETRLRADIDEVDIRCSKEIGKVRSYNSRATGEMFDLMRSQNEKFTEGLRLQNETFTYSMGKHNTATNKELNTLSKEVGKLSGILEAQKHRD